MSETVFCVNNCGNYADLKIYFDYITYSTPNDAARNLIEDEEIRNSEIAFPDESILERCKVYNYLGTDGDKLYDKYWTKVGAE